MHQPGKAVTSDGNEQIRLNQLAEDETQNQRRSRPTPKHHQITQHAKAEGHNQIGKLAVGRVAADKNQQQDKRNNQAASDVRHFGELVENGETQDDSNDIGDNQSPNHGEG